jgi:hypothetical protein
LPFLIPLTLIINRIFNMGMTLKISSKSITYVKFHFTYPESLK